ncbi:hypothetical protein K435DRAFT_804912 [Dendrothele bispora CBS 962.96]|uniref:Chromatin elongation factor spt5 n=1 Tax=Dendrothele bispora (strain CBS 962.96) TaxID=1314807 RepID=A0A4S8LCS2_DENBC|nr:hypothetical protein K435DRAFT_804912 [Dendrothele bispora CBS 962.96]
MSNPFVDTEAQVDDDDDFQDDPLFLPGSDDEEDSNGDLRGTGVQLADEGKEEDEELYYDLDDLWQNKDLQEQEQKDNMDATFTDYLMERYVQRTSFSPPREHHDDTLSNAALRTVLLSSERGKDCFWRVKCKPGRETELVFDLMLREQEKQTTVSSRVITPAPVSETTTNHSNTNTEMGPSTLTTESAEEKAFNIVCQYATDPSGSIPATHAELQRVLGPRYSSVWEQALNAATLSDPEEDPLDALKRVTDMKPHLVPCASTASPAAPSETIHASISESSSSPVLTLALKSNEPEPLPRPSLKSAFSVPTVAGFIYLEAELGLHPQDSDLIDSLRDNKLVIKRQEPFHDLKTVRQTRRRAQVWLEKVPCEEVAVLLDTRAPSIPMYSWIKFRRGTYKDDVGLVVCRETSAAQRRLAVLLVPRLTRPTIRRSPTPDSDAKHNHNESQTKKRKRGQGRPSQVLFRAEDHSWADVSTHQEHHFVHKAQEYEYGLLKKYVDYNSVTPIEVAIDDNTRRLFRASGHPILRSISFPVAADWTFFYEEKVYVLCHDKLTQAQINNPDLPREIRTRKAIILSVEKNRCMVQFNNYEGLGLSEEDAAEWVWNVNLRKVIHEGDGVEVVAGQEKGLQGLVIYSWKGLLQVMDIAQKIYWIDANVCRVTRVRAGESVPWVGHLVTIFNGPYRNYQGVVTDVHPPRPQHTMLEVRILDLLVTVSVPHDHVYDTTAVEFLSVAYPLTSAQQHFRQTTWDTEYSPNIKFAVYDYHERRYLLAEDAIKRPPEQPWIGKQVRVVSKEYKSLGMVKQVERSGKSPSGLRVQVEVNVFTAVHGIPVIWFDYCQVYDPMTGLPLELAFPLQGPQRRYWRPLISQKPIPRDRLTLPASGEESGSDFIAWKQAQERPATPPWGGEFVDPFAVPPPSAGPSTAPPPPTHWVLDPRLVGKRFYARWEPRDEFPMEKVAIEPVGSGIIHVLPGAETLIGHAQEIHDCKVGILPRTNKRPMIAVRGEHTGKNMRQVHYRINEDNKEFIIGAVFKNWGTSAEAYVDNVLVGPEDLAEVPKDFIHNPNEKRFGEVMTRLRREARAEERRPRKQKKST